MKRYRFLTLLFICFVFLSGCQGSGGTEKEVLTAGEPAKAENAEKKVQETASFSLKPEEIAKEPEGVFFKKYIQGKELAGDEEYEKAAAEAVNAWVKKMESGDTKNQSAEDWAQSLFTALRTNYGSTIQPIKDFSVVYNKLKLPDGRLLQDVTEEELNGEADRVNVAILLDASGSMKADVEGGNKMDLAKASLKSFSESLPENVDVSLSVFGHRGTGSDEDKELSCSSIETVYPLSSYSQEKFSAAVNSFQASGWTPLAAAIEKAEQDLSPSADEKEKTFIYIISDGIETCGGNPVEAAKKAKSAVTGLQINIIGFDVDDEADRQLKEVAKEGGGEYSTAQNKQQLEELITKSWREKVGKVTWMFWNVSNSNDINWTSVELSNKLRALENDAITARNREHRTMNAALQQLSEAGLIDSEMQSKIKDLLYERLEKIKQYTQEILSAKHAEIHDTADRLRKIVDRTSGDLD